MVPGQDAPDMLHTVILVRMHHNATRLLDAEGGCVMELSADGFDCSANLYPEMKMVGVKLASYKVRSPEGVLAEVNCSTVPCNVPYLFRSVWYLCHACH